jgi:hypothetical protein
VPRGVPADEGFQCDKAAVFVAAIRTTRYLGLNSVDSGTAGEYEEEWNSERSGCVLIEATSRNLSAGTITTKPLGQDSLCVERFEPDTFQI